MTAKNGGEFLEKVLDNFFSKAGILGVNREVLLDTRVFGDRGDSFPVGEGIALKLEGGSKLSIGMGAADYVFLDNGRGGEVSLSVFDSSERSNPWEWARVLSWKNRKLHNAADGAAAVEYFQQTEGGGGLLLERKHYCMGELWDPDEETPAETTWYDNGSIKSERHYVNGKCQSRGDRPAVVEYYYDGGKREELFLDASQNMHRAPQKGPAEVQYTKKGEVMIKRYYLEGVELDPRCLPEAVPMRGGLAKGGRIGKGGTRVGPPGGYRGGGR